jgi:RecA-family ATPase
MANAGGYTLGMCKPDRSDLVDRLNDMIAYLRLNPTSARNMQNKLREAVRNRCAFERTTPAAMKLMGLL